MDVPIATITTIAPRATGHAVIDQRAVQKRKAAQIVDRATKGRSARSPVLTRVSIAIRVARTIVAIRATEIGRVIARQGTVCKHHGCTLIDVKTTPICVLSAGNSKAYVGKVDARIHHKHQGLVAATDCDLVALGINGRVRIDLDGSSDSDAAIPGKRHIAPAIQSREEVIFRATSDWSIHSLDMERQGQQEPQPEHAAGHGKEPAHEAERVPMAPPQSACCQ